MKPLSGKLAQQEHAGGPWNSALSLETLNERAPADFLSGAGRHPKRYQLNAPPE